MHTPRGQKDISPILDVKSSKNAKQSLRNLTGAPIPDNYLDLTPGTAHTPPPSWDETSGSDDDSSKGTTVSSSAASQFSSQPSCPVATAVSLALTTKSEAKKTDTAPQYDRMEFLGFENGRIKDAKDDQKDVKDISAVPAVFYVPSSSDPFPHDKKGAQAFLKKI